MKQYKLQCRLEKLIDKNPLPCRVINREVKYYIENFSEDNYIKAYAQRYEERLRASAELPFQ